LCAELGGFFSRLRDAPGPKSTGQSWLYVLIIVFTPLRKLNAL
jgi:hypothetical protein